MNATMKAMTDALSELLAEWDNARAREDHRSGITPDTGGIILARQALELAGRAQERTSANWNARAYVDRLGYLYCLDCGNDGYGRAPLEDSCAWSNDGPCERCGRDVVAVGSEALRQAATR